MQHLIRRATAADVQACLNISNADAAVSHTNFTIEPETLDDWERAFNAQGGRWPWFIAQRKNIVEGFARSGPWHGRCGYRDAAIVSVYIEASARGQGLGRRLYAALLPALVQGGFHSIIAAIALPNPASIALHESFGFSHVGTFHEVGWKFDRRWDVSYWELVSDSGD